MNNLEKIKQLVKRHIGEGYVLHITETDQEALKGLVRDYERMQKAIRSVACLIDESEGVAGLHLNGEVAPWEELLQGGHCEEWLLDLSQALKQTEQGE